MGSVVLTVALRASHYTTSSPVCVVESLVFHRSVLKVTWYI